MSAFVTAIDASHHQLTLGGLTVNYGSAALQGYGTLSVLGLLTAVSILWEPDYC